MFCVGHDNGAQRGEHTGGNDCRYSVRRIMKAVNEFKDDPENDDDNEKCEARIYSPVLLPFSGHLRFIPKLG